MNAEIRDVYCSPALTLTHTYLSRIIASGHCDVSLSNRPRRVHSLQVNLIIATRILHAQPVTGLVNGDKLIRVSLHLLCIVRSRNGYLIGRTCPCPLGLAIVPNLALTG